MSKILLTCFEAFNNKSTNTTTLVAEKINQDNIYKLTLPVSYTRSVEVLKNVVRDYKPDLIISLGEANRTKNVEIEKFAHNIQHASIPDNDGVIKINEKINDSSLCLTPNYDVHQMVSKLQKDGYNVIMSQSAACTALPIDWKNTAVILIKHVTVSNDRYILNVFSAKS